MGLLQKLKRLFTGKDSKKSSTRTTSGSIRDASRISNYGGGGSYSVRRTASTSASYRKAVARQKKKEEEKKQQIASAFKAVEKKAGQSTTKTPIDPKQKILNERAAKRKNLLDAFKAEQAEFHALTKNKYNPNTGDKEHDALARQLIKGGFDSANPVAERMAVKYHPKLYSATRGALSGVTFGGSELLTKYAPRSEEWKESEEYYQQNKSKGAELAGEIVGSLASFGLTGGASATGVKAAASRLAPRALEKTSAGAVERLAASSLVRRAAEKEAIKRLGAGATKEAIAQIARRKAEQAVAELGKDVAINLTTGLAADVSHSLIDSSDENGNINWGQFAKNMGINAGMNVALGGATSLIPAARVSRAGGEVLDAVRPAQVVDDVVRPQAAIPEAPVVDNAVEQIARREDTAATNAMRQNQEAAEQIVREQDNVSNFASVDEPIPTDNPRQTAQNDTRAALENRAKVLAEDITPSKPKASKPKAEAETGAVPKGVEQAREAYTKNTGEVVGGDKPTNFSDRYDAYKEYHKSQGTESRRKQSKAAASQINAMTSDAERNVREKLVKAGSLDYDTVVTKEMYDKVSKEFKGDAEHWIGRIVDGSEDLKTISADEIPDMQARCQYLMAVLDPSKDEAAEGAYTAAFKLAKDISSKSGQSLNLRRNFVHLTEAGKIESTVDDLVNLLDSSIGFERKHKLPRGKYDRINAIKGILMDDPEIKSGIETLVKAKNEDDVAEAYTKLMLTLNKQNPKTGFDVIQELRYLNMLGNPKTHIRNVFGSALFSPMRTISNTIRGSIEDSIAKKAGLEITRHGGISPEAFLEARAKNPRTEAGKKAAEAFDNLKRDILGSAKYDNVRYKGRAKTPAGKFLDTLSDLNSSLLSKEDDFFRQRAFKENYIKSYNKYLKNGTPITDKIERQIEQEAIKESQIATFNEYNSLAEFLSKIERKAYDAKATTGERAAGAAVNAVMPFTKVPANILKQSVNYSPAGIARGYANIAKAAKRGDAQLLNAAIDQLSSGLTGSGVMALGLFLGKNTEAFTTNAGKDDYAAKFKKAQGVQNYSVTFTDPDTGKAKSVTLDWLVPTSSVFFMGVELANQMKSGDFNALDFGGDWAQITSRLIEPVMETSMLSGLYSTLESMRSSYGDDDKQSALSLMMRETAQSYLNSLVPTVSGQLARTAYKSDKQVSGDTDWEYFRNSMKSKTGLAADNKVTRKLGIEPLGADTTAYGDVKGKKTTDIKDVLKGDPTALKEYGASALKNFLSPANIQDVDLSALDKEKIKMYEDAVKNGADPQDMSYLFPKKQYKKQFSVGDMDVKMSNKDLSTYNQAKTKGGEEAMRLALEGIMFNRYEKDGNGKRTILKNGYTKDQKEELIKAAKGMSMREIEQWLYEQPQFRSASEAEQRKVINHMWSLSGQGKSQGAKRVGEQAVIKAQGGDVDQYNFKNEVTQKKQEAIQSAIDGGIVTYAEVVDFARNAGKTYYYENDEGGTANTYFNKKEMIEYLAKKGYSYEKAEALFNAFKASNAKPYSGNNLYSGRRGYYRRRGYRRRGRGGSSKQLVSQTVKQSAFKTKEFNPDVATPKPRSGSSSRSGTKTLAAALQDLQKVEAKIKPPKNK